MYRAEETPAQRCAEQGVPLVLAMVSGAAVSLREQLLTVLALCCARQGGRVLVLELGPSDSACDMFGPLTEAPDLAGVPAKVLGSAEGVMVAGLACHDQAEMYMALDRVTSPPARFDLVLLNVRGDTPQEHFLASLAQRVIVALPKGASPEDASGLIKGLASRFQQRHYTLAIDAELQEARRFYAQMVADVALSQVECDLLEGLSRGLSSPRAFAASEECLALFKSFHRKVRPLEPRGSLQLFWQSVLFCSECSVKLCREILASGQSLDVCPVQRF